MSVVHKQPGFKRAALKVARGTPTQAAEYCKKDGTYWEIGLRRKDSGLHPGSKDNLMQSQLEKVKTLIKDGAGLQKLMDDATMAFARYPKFCLQYAALQAPPIREDLQVALFYGKPNTGKTRYAYTFDHNLFSIPVKSGNTTWFSNYDGQETVLIDDFAGEFRLTELLRLLDVYPIQVETKGGHCWFKPKTIIITSNVPWQDWYNYDKRQDSKAALQRRIHGFYYCKHDNEEYTVEETTHEWVSKRPPVLDDDQVAPGSPNLIDPNEDSDLELRASTSDWENINLQPVIYMDKSTTKPNCYVLRK